VLRSSVTVIALSLLAMSSTGIHGQTPLNNAHDFNVSVTSTWTATGWAVTLSDTLLIYAQGTISDGAGNWNDWFGPDGISPDMAGGCVDCPLPGYPKAALIARIGAGDPFFVGSFRSFVCDAAGELFLGVNDNTPGDNLGTLNAHVWGALTEAEPPDTTCAGCDDPLCSSGQYYLGSLSGDTGADVLTDSHYGEEWIRFAVIENESLPAYLSATIELVPPAGADYDLYAWCNSCGGTLIGSSQNSGSTPEVIHVRAEDEWGIADDFDVIIEIRCHSVFVPHCEDNWSLTITGHTTVGSTTCN